MVEALPVLQPLWRFGLYALVVWTVGLTMFWLHFGATSGLALAAWVRRGARWLFGWGVLGLTLVAFDLAGEPQALWDPTLFALVWETQAGRALPWLLAGALALMVTTPQRQRWRDTLAVAGAVAVLMSLAVAGHATTLGWWGAWLLMAHAVAWVYWAGALVPLRRLCQQAMQRPQALPVLHHVLVRFGRYAVAYLLLLALSGLAMALGLVGSWEALLRTAYGQLLLLKLALAAGLYTVGALNKWRMVPALQWQEQGSALALRRAIEVEMALMMVLALVAGILTTSVTLP